MWGTIPFHVDRDSAKWSAIPLPTQNADRFPAESWTTSNGMTGPLPLESPDHIDRNPQIGNQRVVKSYCGLACDVGKDSVVRFRGFGDHADTFQILSDALGGHQPARLTFALDKQHNDFTLLAIFCRHNVTPAKILHLRRPHACIAGNQ